MKARARMIQMTLQPGVCRWCGCDDDHACADGCTWADANWTLCSACVQLERAMRNPSGRRALAEFVQEHGFVHGAQISASARP